MFPFNDNGKMLFPKPWDSREGQWDDNINAWNVYPSVEVALEMLEYRYIGQEIPLIYEGRQTSFWFVGGTADEDFQEKIPETPTPTLQSVTTAGNTTTQNIDVTSGAGYRGGHLDLYGTTSGRIGFVIDQTSVQNTPDALIRRRDSHISIRDAGLGSSTNYAQLSTGLLTEERVYNFPDASGTLALVSDLIDGYIPLSQKASPDGVATLDSAGTVPVSQLPDSVFGQMKFGGTYDGITITASSDFPELNGQPLPAATDYEGVYFISTDDYTEGGIDYVTGDWIVSTGIEWTRVANSDAVTSVFGRVGNILAVESDYQSFYPRLSQSYDNPSWVNTLSYSKITGTPDFILSGDVKPSDLVGFSGAARVPISNGSGQDFFASIAASQTAISNALARYKSDSSLSVGTATLNDEAVNLGQLNTVMGSYLPLAGGIMNSGATIDMGTYTTPAFLRFPSSLGTFVLSYKYNVGSLELTGPINAQPKLRFPNSNNETNPNIQIAQFFGSVIGRMPSSVGDGSGYEGSFVTQPYLSSQIGAYLPLAGGTMSGNINMGNNQVNNASGFISGTFSGNYGYLYPSGLTIARLGSGSYPYQVDASNNFSSFSTPIEVGSGTGYEKLRLLAADNRPVEVGGDPNTQVAEFHGSVRGKMPTSVGNGSGYVGFYATQPYVTSQLGSYLPLSGGASSPMTGDLFMGNKGIYQASLVRVGTNADNAVDISPSAINMEIDNNGPYSFNLLSTDLGVYSPIGVPSQTATRKIGILPVDNRSVGGNPNVTVSRFYGSVLGRMDGTTGANGYESQFTTQNYVDNNFVDKSTNQTGIGGTKEWTGQHTFATTAVNPKIILKGNTAGGTNNTLVFNDNTDTQVGYLGFASGTASNGMYLNATNDVPIRLRTNGADQAILSSSGLQISPSGTSGVAVAANTIVFQRIAPGTTISQYDGSGTTATSIRNYAAGGVQITFSKGGVDAAGAYTNTSDSTIKNIVTDFDYSAVDSLKATSFTYKDNRDSGRIHVGYIAQEVREVLPDAVYESEETGLLSVDHVQVLIAKIALIEDRIKQLESLTIN